MQHKSQKINACHQSNPWKETELLKSKYRSNHTTHLDESPSNPNLPRHRRDSQSSNPTTECSSSRTLRGPGQVETFPVSKANARNLMIGFAYNSCGLGWCVWHVYAACFSCGPYCSKLCCLDGTWAQALIRVRVMQELIHAGSTSQDWYCWCLKKSQKTTTWDVYNLVNNGINNQPQLVQDVFHQQCYKHTYYTSWN